MTTEAIRTRKKSGAHSRTRKARAKVTPQPLLPAAIPPSERRDSIVVVLGMHRSGTSLLSNVLHYLGADMADETDHISAKNPGGFWERPDLVALNDEILAAIGAPIASPMHSVPLPTGWWRRKEVLAIKIRLRERLEASLESERGWWGFKDPRTCRLLPLWNDVFEEVGVRPYYVWAIRSPGEAAASMAAKNPSARPMSPEQAEVTWLAYNYDVLRYSLSSQPLVIEFGDWFKEPMTVARRILARIPLRGFVSDQELSECLQRIVNPTYRHQVEGTGTAVSTIPLAQTLFAALTPLACSEQPDYARPAKYIPMLDVTFRAMRPFVTLLDQMPALRMEAREFRQKSARASLEVEALKAQVADLVERERAALAVAEAKSLASHEVEALKAQVADLVERERAALAVAEAKCLASLEVEPLKVQVADLVKRERAALATAEANSVDATEVKRALDQLTMELAASRAELARLKARFESVTWELQEASLQRARLSTANTREVADLRAENEELKTDLRRASDYERVARRGHAAELSGLRKELERVSRELKEAQAQHAVLGHDAKQAAYLRADNERLKTDLARASDPAVPAQSESTTHEKVVRKLAAAPRARL